MNVDGLYLISGYIAGLFLISMFLMMMALSVGREFGINVNRACCHGAATCATIAKLAIPELTRRGYHERITIGSLAGSGTLGLLIPPSIIMIVSAVQAEVSLVQMFLAGFVPGTVVMLLYSGYIALWSLLHPDNQPPPEPSSSFLAKLKASASLIPTFLLIGFLEL